MMKTLLAGATVLSGLLLVPTAAVAGPFGDGMGQPTNANTCLGMERASRNSRDGNRELGQFGQDQREFVALFSRPQGYVPDWPIKGKVYNSYGEWLNDSKMFGC